jgi:DNA-directed RNA polymerase specialized sigma24 family protein
MGSNEEAVTMTRDRTGVDLEKLLADRGRQLIGSAIALAGSRQDGEDLLQAALERVLRRLARPAAPA